MRTNLMTLHVYLTHVLLLSIEKESLYETIYFYKGYRFRGTEEGV